jgi:hypothetical protein
MLAFAAPGPFVPQGTGVAPGRSVAVMLAFAAPEAHRPTLDGCGTLFSIMTMLSAEKLLTKERERILRIAAKYGARNIRIFGSVARGEADTASDVDFLVDMEAGRSLLDLGGLQIELESLLGCRVDVVTERGLKARIRDRVLREAVPV